MNTEKNKSKIVQFYLDNNILLSPELLNSIENLRLPIVSKEHLPFIITQDFIDRNPTFFESALLESFNLSSNGIILFLYKYYIFKLIGFGL
jgi:hypothetical protein